MHPTPPRLLPPPLIAALCLAALAGCTGSATLDGMGGPGGGGGGPGTGLPAGSKAQFECKSTTQAPGIPLRRLSRAQYLNTVSDLVRRALPTDAPAILTALAPTLDRVPMDARVGAPGQRRGGFSALDQSLQQARADAAYDLAVAVGRELTSSSARLSRLLGTCATDASTANDASCLDAFVRRFGARVYRRPLDEAEVTLLLTGTQSAPVSAPVVADVVGLLFASPHTTFFVEHGTEPGSATPRLSGYELASRLSYHFWRTTPDDALWDSATSGALLTAEGLKAQVDRLAADPRAAATWGELFSEWFALEELEELNGLSTSPVFRAFAGADLPTADTREAAISDVVEMAKWTIGHGGSFSALLNERRSFAKDPLLARLYGAPAWDGTAEPPAPASPSRAGLLTRVAFLASGTADTRPILKGARIRNSLMCETIQLPPGNVAAVPPKPSSTATTREVVETLTQSSAACGGCHTQLINPMGFSTENFDALGRERVSQPLFDESGAKVGERPVDTRTELFISTLTGLVSSQGAADLTRLIDDSGRMHSCFARQYFRFTQARIEDLAQDGCALAELEKAAQDGAPLADILKLPALREQFGRRSFP